MYKITIKYGEQSCHIIKNEIHTTTNLYLPVTAERLVAMLDEAAAQATRKQISDGVVRVDLDETKFTITNLPSQFTITLREYVRGLEVLS